MKTILLIISILNISIYSKAQTCNSYFNFKKGSKMEMTSYDKKNKPTLVMKYEIKDIKSIGGSLKYTINYQTFDPKGKEMANTTMESSCKNGVYETELRSFGGEMMPTDANMKVNVTGDKVLYPSKLNVGDKLQDAAINVKTEMNGMTLMNMNVQVTDREIVSQESLTTPAGTFDCLKISYTVNFKMMGQRSSKTIEYIAKGLGLIKTESYNEKGKLTGVTILTALSQ